MQRSACTSIDSQHTGHLYALKVGQKVWLCRDNVGPWTPTIEFDSKGLSKKMSKFYNEMLNRATRIEVYWLVNVPRTDQQHMLHYPHLAAVNNPDADLRSIMFKGRGRPKFEIADPAQAETFFYTQSMQATPTKRRKIDFTNTCQMTQSLSNDLASFNDVDF